MVETAIDNLSWIFVNVSLALLAVGFGLVFLKARQKWLKYLSFILWFLFLPNTIYLLTDIQYLPNQFLENSGLSRIILLIEFGFLMAVGFWSYLLAIKPLDKVLNKKSSFTKNLIVVLVNLFIAFAVAIGKVQRTESWYVFTNLGRVINDSLSVLMTAQLVLFIVIFALITNFIYFYFKAIGHKR